MKKEILKKALLQGIGSAVLTWVIYSLVFEMLIDKLPFAEAFFGRSSLIFLAIFFVIETVGYYISLSKKEK